MSTSELGSGPTMWWHADLPAPTADPGTSQPSGLAREDRAAPAADGSDLLEWILPTLSADRARMDPKDGSARRTLRRQLREEG